MRRFILPALTAVLMAVPVVLPAAPAAEANPVEAKLRETLRATMTQLRTAQTEKAQAQAELQALQTKSEAEIKDLKSKLDDLTKHSTKEMAEADKMIAELKQAIESKDSNAAILGQTLEKWKNSHAKITAIAQKKEAQRAGLAAKTVDLDRVVADRERRNLELYRLGNEILTRYEKFGLGQAITAREPFTGITRARLEGLVEGYRDKLTDQLAKSGEPVPAPAAPAATARPVPEKAPAATAKP